MNTETYLLFFEKIHQLFSNLSHLHEEHLRDNDNELLGHLLMADYCREFCKAQNRDSWKIKFIEFLDKNFSLEEGDMVSNVIAVSFIEHLPYETPNSREWCKNILSKKMYLQFQRCFGKTLEINWKELILAFDEDGGIHIFDDESAACFEWEGIDVENGVVQFYTGEGVYLKPIFDVPNKHEKFLWIFESIESGKFHLREDKKTDNSIGSISQAVSKATYLKPNPWVAEFSILKNKFKEPLKSV